jgi:hypothetical protein
MAETFKERSEHRGKPAPHLGQDHYEKSRIEAAASRNDVPTFASEGKVGDSHEQPQQPADVTHQAQQAIEKGSESNRNRRTEALEKAVKDLDNGLAIKPD